MSMDDKIAASFQSADSPFLPGTKLQYAWDSVSLTSFLSCGRRYQYAVIEGLVPRNPNYAIALVFGIQFHKLLELYHKYKFSGMDHNEASQSAITDLVNDPVTATLPTDLDVEEIAEKAAADADEDDGITLRNSKIRTRFHLIRAGIWYLEQYANDAVKTLALPTGAPAVEVSFRVPLPLDVGQHPVLLCGHIDRAVDFQSFYYVSDYKTTKSLTKQFFQMFDLSHQMTGYSTAGTIIFDRPTKGVMIDGIALQVGKVSLARHFTNRSPGQVKEYFALLADTMERATLLHHRYQEGGEPYPMNTSACYFCDYKNICSQPPEYRESYIQQQYVRAPGWNPLENR